MKTIAILIFAVAISLGVVGCQTNGQPPTSEAVKFYAFKDTWSAAHAAYQGYCEQVVLGNVSKADEAEIDRAWNTFRFAFKLSLREANKDWTAPTPDDIQKLKESLITIIRSAL